jgi:regulation of enolase protein 1 (concanavalin A-like superfamily)
MKYQMNFILCGVVMFCSGCTPSSDVNPNTQLASTEIHESFFEQPADPWEWIRENPATHKSGPDGLQIMIEPGGLMGGGKDARNILVRPLPRQAQSVSVQVAAQHQSQYEQAGLILYVDDDNYIKFVLEMVDGKFNAVMVVEREAEILGVFPVPNEKPFAHLVMKFEEGKVVCWADNQAREQDAEDLQDTAVKVGEFPYPMTPWPRIGVFTQSGEMGALRWATFTNFHIQ